MGWQEMFLRLSRGRWPGSGAASPGTAGGAGSGHGGTMQRAAFEDNMASNCRAEGNKSPALGVDVQCRKAENQYNSLHNTISLGPRCLI